MASRGLGTLTLDLIAKIGGFEQGMDKAARHADKRMREIERRAQGFGNSLGRSLKSAAGGLLGFLGVATSVAAAVDSIKSAIDRADNIRDLSIRLGLSTEALSAFSYAAQQTGTDLEALNKGLLRLSKNATAALDPKSRQSSLFKALGISEEQLKDLDTLVPAIADKFAGMADGVQKAALAQELFGKSGAQLIEFLNQGKAGLDAMADRAAALGIIIDKDTAEAADRFNDTLADLKAAIGGVAQQVAAALLPQLQELLDWAVAFVSDGDNAKEVADSIATAFDGIVTAGKAIGSVIDVLQGVRDVLAGLEKEAVAAGEVMRTALTLDISGFKKALQDYKTGAAQIQAGFDGRQFEDPRKPQRRTTPIPNLTVPFMQPLFPQFSAVPLPTPTRPQAVDQSALDRYYRTGGRTASGGGGGGRKGKKDTSLEDAARDAEKAREELKRLVEQEAQARDQFEAMAASLAGPVADANFQFIKDQERLNELAKEGAIGATDLAAAQENLRVAHEKNIAALEAQLTPSQEVIAGLREEIELIGMSDIAQQKLIATRQAGAEATAEEVAEIERLIEVREQAAKAADLQREIEAGLADAMFDVISGTKSAGDAVKDFFDDLAKYILRMITENWAKQIAGLFSGSASSGSGGGGTNWIGMIAGLFGGGKASGGSVSPGTMYRVNENGTEMLSIGGKDYLMMGSQPGRITPNHQLQTAGGTSYGPTNIYVQGAPDRRTTSMIDRANGRRARREMARTGA